jgi:hypothetical protein
MSDAEWCSVTAHEALPDSARAELDSVVDWFLKCERGMKQRDPPEARRRLDAARKAIEAAIREIEAFPQDALDAMLFDKPREGFGFASTPLSLLGKLSSDLDQMKHLEQWLAVARDRVQAKPPGDSAANRRELLRQVDMIRYHHTGKIIDRSSKGKHTPLDFADAVFKIADPSVTRAAIIGWIKELKAWRDETGAQCQDSRAVAGPILTAVLMALRRVVS